MTMDLLFFPLACLIDSVCVVYYSCVTNIAWVSEKWDLVTAIVFGSV